MVDNAQLRIDTLAPVAPGVPDLLDDLDTGSSFTDNVTSARRPVLRVSLDETDAEAGDTVELLRNTTVVNKVMLTEDDLANGHVDIPYQTTDADLAAGVYNMSARVLDAAGNTGATSAADAFTIDFAAPAAPGAPNLIDAHDTGISITDNITQRNANLTLTSTVEQNASAIFFDDKNNNGLVDLDELLGLATVDGTLATLDGLSLADGVYRVRSIQTDLAGNIGPASATTVLTIDSTAPSISSITTTTASGFYRSGTIPISIHLTEPVYFAGTSLKLSATLSNGKLVEWTPTANTAYSTLLLSYVVNAADGQVDNLTVTAITLTGTSAVVRDAAGNLLNLSELPFGLNIGDSRDIRIDTQAPGAPGAPDLIDALDTGVSNTDNITSERRPVLRVSLEATNAEAGDTLELYWSTTRVNTTTLTAEDLANGFADIAYQASNAELAARTYSMKARLIDQAGNVGADSAVKDFTVDFTAPNAPGSLDLATQNDLGQSSTDNITSANTDLTFTATVEANAGVEFFNDINDNGVIDAGESLGIATVVNTTATLDNLSLADGVYRVRAIQTDLAGNSSVASTTLVTTIDTQTAFISSITTTRDSGSFKAGATVPISINFNETVHFGTSTSLVMSLSNGKEVSVAVTAGTAYSALSFTYTVGANDTNVDALNVTGISLGSNITVRDTAGNVADLGLPTGHNLADLKSIRIDTVNPGTVGAPVLEATSDTGLHDNDGITRSVKPEFRVELNDSQAEMGDTLELRNNATVLGTAVLTQANIDQGFALVAPTNNMAGSNYTLINARLLDKAGNPGLASTNTAFLLDVTAPAAPTSLDLAADDDLGHSNSDNVTSKTTGLTITMNTASSAGNYITVFNDINLNGLLDDGEALVAWAPTTGATFSTDIDLANGTHSIRAAQLDLAGNMGISSALVISVDDTPGLPVIESITSSTPDGSYAAGSVIQVLVAFNKPVAFSGSTGVAMDMTLSNGKALTFTPVLNQGYSTVSFSYTVAAADVNSADLSVGALVMRGSWQARDVDGQVLSLDIPTGANLADKHDIVIDTQAPAAPAAPDLMPDSDSGFRDDDNITSVLLPTFSVSLTGAGAEAGGKALVYRGTILLGEQLITPQDMAAGFVLVTLSAPLTANAAQTITARLTDLAGNQSALSAGLSVTHDSTAPAVPSSLDLALKDDLGISGTDNITSKTTGLSFSARGVAGSYVTLFNDKDNNGVMDDGEALVSDQLITTTAFAAQVDLAEGVHNIRVFQTDAAGNASAVSAALVVTVEETPPNKPAAPVLDAADDSGPLNNDAYTTRASGLTFAGDAPTGVQQVRIYSDANNNGQFDAGEIHVLRTVTAAGTYSGDLALTANASYNIRQDFISTGGVVSESSDALLLTIDTIAPPAPPVPSLTPSTDSGFSNTDNITSQALPSIRVSLANGDAGAGGKAQVLNVTTLVAEQLITLQDVANGYVDVPLVTPLQNNDITTLAARVMDAAGNQSKASEFLIVTHDDTAPVAPFNIALNPADDLGVSSSDGLTSKMSGLRFSMFVEEGAYVTLFDDKNNNNLMDEGEALLVDQRATNSTFNTALSFAEGEYKLKAFQTDQAGNVSDVSEAFDLKIVTSNVLPKPITLTLDAEDDTGPSNTDGITSISTGLTFRGVADIEAGVSKVRVFSDANNNGLFDADEIGAIFAVKEDGSFAVDFTLTPNMTHNMRVIQITESGILSEAGPAKIVTIDTFATTPVVNTLVTSSLEPVLTGSAMLTSDEVMTVQVNGATYDVVPDPLTHTWRLDLGTQTPASGTLEAFEERTYEVVAKVVDALGNTSFDTTLGELNIDTTPPAMPVIVSQVMAANSLVVSGTAVLNLSEQLWLYVEDAQYALIPNAAGAWSIDLATATPVAGDPVNIANGPFTVRVDAVDFAGNISRTVQGSNNDMITADADAVANLKLGQALVDGGDGYDTFRLLGAGVVLDLTKVTADAFKSIERIDITGSGDNALILSEVDLPNTLVVDGNAGDVMTFRGLAQMVSGAGETVFVDVNGNGTNDGETETFTTDAQGKITASLGNGLQTYSLFTVGDRKILVDTDITSFTSTPTITSMGKDSPNASGSLASTTDFVTTVGEPGHLFTGSLSSPLPSSQVLQINVNGGGWVNVPAANVTGTSWAYTDISARFLPEQANNSVAVRLLDVNTLDSSRVETQAITVLSPTMAAPVITKFGADDGLSDSDGITGAAVLSSVSGTATANSRVTVYLNDTTEALGSTMADSSGEWTLSGLSTSLLTDSLQHKLYAVAAFGDATSDWSAAKDVFTTGLVENGNFSAGTAGSPLYNTTNTTLYKTSGVYTLDNNAPWSMSTQGDTRAIWSNVAGTMWSQEVEVKAHTDYTFSYFTGYWSLNTSLVYARIESLDGAVLNTKAALMGGSMGLNTLTWNSGANTSVELSINLDSGGAVLDGIRFYANDLAEGDLINGTPDSSVLGADDTLPVIDNGEGLPVVALLGGLGDDVFELADTQMGYLSRAGAFIDGGAGIDTLKLTGAGQVLDLSEFTGINSKAVMQSIEIIDITGTGDNTLKLSLNDVLHLGSVNAFAGVEGAVNSVQMKVEGDAGDKLELKDLIGATDPGAWVQADNYVSSVTGNTYNVFNYSALNAQLLVDADIHHSLHLTGHL